MAGGSSSLYNWLCTAHQDVKQLHEARVHPVPLSVLLTSHSMAVSTATSYSPAVATASRSTATNSTPLQSLQHSLYPSSLPPSSYTSPATTPCTVASRLINNPAIPPQGMLGNDRLDPTRLSLNNGINHGDYIIGPLIQPVNGTPVKIISEYIAKKEGTYDFVILKVLTLSAYHTHTHTHTHNISNWDVSLMVFMYVLYIHTLTCTYTSSVVSNILHVSSSYTCYMNS